MSLPKLYLETTIPSYLTARRSRALRLAAHQEVTEEWWSDHRHEYELYISDLVLDEAGGGEAAFVASRLAALAGISKHAQKPLPQQRHAVGRKVRIARYQRQAFGLRLGDEQAIERVAVVMLQSAHGSDVGHGDGQQGQPALWDGGRKESFKLARQSELVE